MLDDSLLGTGGVAGTFPESVPHRHDGPHPSRVGSFEPQQEDVWGAVLLQQLLAVSVGF